MDGLLRIAFQKVFQRGNLQVTGAGGTVFTAGDGTGKPIALKFTSYRAQWGVILDAELKAGEAYMDGGLVMERGDIADFLDALIFNISRQKASGWTRLLRLLRKFARSSFALNNLLRASRNARHHYNIDHRLYRLFLDEDMQYSCAYFAEPDYTIDQAQLAKKQLIASKLYLDVFPSKKLKVLDIGSGWGGLGMHLAREHSARVTGINLSNEQVKIAQMRAKAAGLDCDFRIQDYRTLTEQFDRIVSVGMFEHVGRQYYRTFFEKCFDTLNDDGVMLLHTIGRWDEPSITNAWVWKYIFPGGYAPTLSELAPVIEKAGFIISDIEVLRIHYAETLRHWRKRFLARRNEVLELFDERFIRMWEFYLAGFEPCFRYYGLEVLQIQLIKKPDTLPLTRGYMRGVGENTNSLSETGRQHLTAAE